MSYSLSETKRYAIDILLGSVFSPSTPVNQSTLFAGRTSQIQELSDSVNQAGLHAVLFGERGVGKTSLANVLPQILSGAGIVDIEPSKVNCDSADTFGSIWKKVLREISISTEQPRLGFTGQTRVDNATLDRMIGDNPSPEDIRYLLQRVGYHLLLIIDEYDRLEDPAVSNLMADTIKALSDHSVNVTIILIGVADTVHDLIAEHQSIDRCLVQVHMPRMSPDELADILDKSLAKVDMSITDDAKEFVTLLSQGFPHYTQLLGLISARHAVRRDRLQIQDEDVASAIQDALRQTHQSITESYLLATASSHKGNLFKQVLLSCALAQVDEQGFFSARDVQRPMSKIMGKPYRSPAFARHLEQFCQPERGPTLQKQGFPRRYRYRFVNPLLQPYVLFHGLSHRLITADLL